MEKTTGLEKKYMQKSKKLCELPWDLTFVNSFPGVAKQETQKSIQTPGAVFAYVDPEPVKSPELLLWSEKLGQEMEIQSSPEDVSILSGNQLCPGMKPYAVRYGGHQFGHWAGQLGDGRAISLGEYQNSKKENFEIQLKGAGPTAYSRRGDGRAVLRSSLREFICSESMHFLGVPTTRALSCVTTGEKVLRDMFYDGNAAFEPGAITSRVAPSFIRFGNFQIFDAHNEIELLEKFTHYVVRRFYPQHATDSTLDLFGFFKEVASKTAFLMSEWLRVGFVHGVMNTDNMSILGLTIDYGPYGWLDIYDPHWTPNTTDEAHKRYRFSAQPSIAQWNLAMLAEALLSLPHLPSNGMERFQEILSQYNLDFEKEFNAMMGSKLGFNHPLNKEEQGLYQKLDLFLRKAEWDTVLFFRELAKVHALSESDKKNPISLLHIFKPSFYGEKIPNDLEAELVSWLNEYFYLSQKEDISPHAIESKIKKMNSVNPYIVPRNYLLQKAIEELEQGNKDYSERLFKAIHTPYTESSLTKEFYGKMPKWARDKPGCSALSCSS